jgi:GLPGLI family protein
MKRLVIILFFAVNTFVQGQSVEGIVTYQRTQYWTKILPKLTFLSKEEMDRELRTWGSNDDGWKTKYQLVFNENESKFTEIQQESEYGYNRRPSEYMIYRDFKNERRIEIEDISARQYMIEDSLKSYSWKIMNKIKEVNGQLCMMAMTEDTIRKQKIVAWFANNIPSSAGPERYFGLPGLIMELDIDDGAVIITALSVEMKPVAEQLKLTKKFKGKKITGTAYDLMIKNILDTAIKGHRYPYSAVRF